MIIIFLVFHIIICILLYLLIRLGILECRRMVMMLAWFVPVWGLVCLVIQEFRSRGKQEVKEDVGVEKLKINDEIHRSILMEEDPIEGRVVPLEEALLINAPSTRRELMMEVMYSDPGNYVDQLQEARMNDDTEVVHYAVTALVELQKEYDLEFQELERKLAETPDDGALLDTYLGLLERYLSSGLLEGSSRSIQLRNYSSLLDRKLKTKGEELSLYRRKIETDIQLKEYDTAYQEISRVLELWPKEETGYLFLIQYYSAVKDRKGIDRTLELLRFREIHLTGEGRSIVEFWKK